MADAVGGELPPSGGDNESSSNTDAVVTPAGLDTVMAEQTAHDVVKEAQSMGDVSSIDVTAKPSNVAPAGNGQAQATSETVDAPQLLKADESPQPVQTEVVADIDAHAVPESVPVIESGDIPADEGDTHSVALDASGGSDTDTSKDLKDPATGHARSNSVKKPTSFKSVSVTKNFLAKTVTTPAAKLSDKGKSPSDSQDDLESLTFSLPGAPTGASLSVAQPSARPRLVAKSALGGLARTAVTNGAAPDASKVWNKNRRENKPFIPSFRRYPALTNAATPPPPPRQITDEELKQQYGIHMATRLQADEAGKESKWADIDDDEDDWAPETVEWMDGTKSSVVPTEAHATPAPGDGDKSATPNEMSAHLSELAGGSPATKPSAPISNKTILKPGVHLQNLIKPCGPSREGSDKSSPAIQPVTAATAKNPWAPLPPIDKVAPLFPQPPPQAVPSMSPFRRDPHGFESLRPPPPGPAREIAADDFNRTWMEDRGPRELFDSKSGRYEPVAEMRRGSVRDHGGRHPALLQRPSQMDQAAPAEPSAAFQTRSTHADGSWARRRASSNVSAGSGGRRYSMGRPQDERFDTMSPMRGVAVESPRQQFAALDAGVSPASVGQGSWSQSSPTFHTTDMTPVAQMSPFANGDVQIGEPGAQDEDPVARQQRLMREKQDATRLRKQREREQEAREEAARKERLRLKLEALGGATPSPELKEPKAKDDVIAPSPQQRQQSTAAAISPPKPPIPTNDGEVAQYGVMKVHQPHPVKRGPNAGVGGEGSIAKRLMPEAQYQSEHQHPTPPSNSFTGDHAAVGPGKRADTHTPLNPAAWKSPSPSTAYNWGNNSANVWGPPQHNNRGLGNGTFNSDYNRIGHGPPTIGPTISSTIDRPGPIAPPRAYKAFSGRSSLNDHPHTYNSEPSQAFSSDSAQLPEHLIPSNLDSFDTPISIMGEDSTNIAAPTMEQQFKIAEWQAASKGGLRKSEKMEVLQERARLQEAGINPDEYVPPQPENQLVTVFKHTKMVGSYGARGYHKIEEHEHKDAADKSADATTSDTAKIAATETKDLTAQLTAAPMVPTPSQASHASAAGSRASRFFPRQEHAATEQASSTKSDSPPPPGNAKLFEDEDAKHPKVKLPVPKPQVKLPPSSTAEPKISQSAAAPQTVVLSAEVMKAKIATLLGTNKPGAAPIASATKAPLDVATKESAKVALPAITSKLEKLSTDVKATTKPMASEVLLEEREFASRPPVRIPKADYTNANLPPVPMKPNPRPNGRGFVPVVEVRSMEPENLFVQEQKGSVVTIYVKLPDRDKREGFTRRAPPRGQWSEFASENKARKNYKSSQGYQGNQGNHQGNRNGNGRRPSHNFRGGRFNNGNPRGNGKGKPANNAVNSIAAATPAQ